MLRTGDRIEGYELIAPLGSGGFGTVWLGRNPSAAPREVAIKVLHPNLVHFRGTSKGPSVADRFLAEARMIQQLDYAGFVRIYGVVDEREKLLIAYVMERLSGRDLTKVIKTVSLPTLLEVIAQTAETLGFLHRNGIIHRDVKGSNIFICDPDPGGDRLHRVKLLDFGIAKEVHADALLDSTATGYFLGTVRSMAPECFHRWGDEGPGLTGAVDQWSLGVTLYYFLSGRMPFDADSLISVISTIESGDPPKLRLLDRFGHDQEAPDGLSAIIARCMAKLPEDRYPDMRDLAAALRQVALTLPPSPNDVTVFDPELAATAADGGTPEGQVLLEARKIARALRNKTSVDDFEPTRQSPATRSRPSIDVVETQLDHPRYAVSEDVAANAPKTAVDPPRRQTPQIPPASSTLETLTSKPKPLVGPLVIDAAEMRQTIKAPAVPGTDELPTRRELDSHAEAMRRAAASALAGSAAGLAPGGQLVPDTQAAFDPTLIRKTPVAPQSLDLEPDPGDTQPPPPFVPKKRMNPRRAVTDRLPVPEAPRQNPNTLLLTVLLLVATALAIYLALYLRGA